MKAILIALFLIASNIHAQSSYNANIKLETTPTLGKWYATKDGAEIIAREVSTVEVFQIYTELKRVLDFYELDFKKPGVDNSYLSSLVKDDMDFKNISFTAKIKESIIDKAWKTDEYLIVYRVNSELTTCGIYKIAK
jgi:hypothetical protein